MGRLFSGNTTWVGRTESASAEIWKQDQESKLAEKVGHRTVDLFSGEAFSLNLSDCIGVQTEYERTITMSAEDSRLGILDAIRRFALFRYRKAITNSFGLSDNGDEPRCLP